MPSIPFTPSQSPEPFHGSRIPPPPEDALKDVEGLLTRLRAEAAGTEGDLEPGTRPSQEAKTRKARLLYEIGEIEERAGDEPAAARDYLASFNADARFREPVEGLLRLLERRRSLRNLGKLVDALGRSAESPDEIVRAKTLRAYFLEDVGGDAEGAKQAAVEATEVRGASPPEAAMGWLTLELFSALVGDKTGRRLALSKRADLATDPTWRSLLRIDSAKVVAAAGDVDAGLETLRAARAEGAGATFAAAVAAERLARRSTSTHAYAEALQVQAALIDEAMASPARGDALGVPRWARSPVVMVDAWLRAAEAQSLAADDAAAAALLDRAREALGRFEGDPSKPALVAALIDARIRMAERTGDTALAAKLAEECLAVTLEDPGVAAALGMRIAEHAASEGDAPRALAALATATEKDPTCVPARALQLDLLADDEPSSFATQLETLAECLPSDDGRARAYLLAAWVWGARANDRRAARLALSQASAVGAPDETVARVARTLASLVDDAVWHEEATMRLLAATPIFLEPEPTDGQAGPGDERPMLLLELARARFARGAVDEARAALKEIGEAPTGAWLGRALEVFLPVGEGDGGDVASARAPRALDELATRPQPDDVARGLVLMAAMRAHRGGDADGARARLQQLAASRPGDTLVETYLAELERSRGALEDVARIAERCAESSDDPELAASLRLEAGLTRWRHGDRAGAIAAFESAVDGAPDAARAVLAWALRGVDADSLDARRRAVARALDGGGHEATLLLERFAIELASGNPREAGDALTGAAEGREPAIALAAAIARAAWSGADDDPDALTAALAQIAGAGAEASTLAAAEEHRRARAAGDLHRVLEASRAWFHGGGGLPAGVEWLAATMAIGDENEEQAARRAIAAIAPPDLREALVASASLLHAAAAPGDLSPLLVGESDAVRLVNLELALPGCDPRRRIAALGALDGALGPDSEPDAQALSGWSWLVDGNLAEALVAFERATAAHPDDLGAWEGLRTAAEAMNDTAKRATACEALGALCKEDARAGQFWEDAGLAATDLADLDRAERAFAQAFRRDASRALSFDRLFRRVRERKDRDLLLEIVGRRLTASDDSHEIAKLFWEQARVLREKGDQEGALKALENVTMLEPDHVGALALTGEIAIRRGNFEEAAESLARLALLPDAPAKNRVTAGIAAVDLFENKLNRFDRALEILGALHRAKLSTLPVRERLARAAARTGSWKDATQILEELMYERPEAEGRIEAARLAMAIHRDRLENPAGARAAIVKLLEEAPTDGEAIDMLLAVDAPADVRSRILENARKVLIDSLQRRPLELPAVKRLAKVARALSDEALQQIALSVALALGGHDTTLEQLFAQVSAKKTRTPQIALSESMMKQVLDPGDRGPVARLFVALGPTIAEALGPSLAGCGVTKRDRVDPRSGIALRNEIATWAGAFGILEFDLYIGGKDELGVQGIPGEPPALVVGAGVNAPLAPSTRARVARELLAMVRGSTIVRHRDDTTVAAIVVASCNLAEVKVDAPSYAMLADVERLLSKAISRKTKKLLPELCEAVVSANADARAWSKRALSSNNRVAALASGDVGIVLVDALGEPLERLPTVAKGDPRVEELVRFVLSPTFVELRRELGLEGGRAVTDPKDKDGKRDKLDLEGVDWDVALTEWEEKSFSPEVAKDKETHSPGSLQGTPLPPPIASSLDRPSAPKPLYVPEAPPLASTRPSTSAPKQSSYRAPSPTFSGEDDDEEAGATVVARIPRELLQKGSESPAAPRSSGGGLGQMFARVERPSAEPPVDDRASVSRAPDVVLDEALFTSAQELELRSPAAPPSAPPRRSRQPAADPHAALPEGEMFDPFAEPDPFARLAAREAGALTPSSIPVTEGTPSIPVHTETLEGGTLAPVEPADAGPALHRPELRSFDPDTDTNSLTRSALHAPSRREYDPNEETSILSKAAFRAHLAEAPDDEGEDPTRFRARGDRTGEPRQTQSWENERPAHQLLPDPLRASFASRAGWLETEARLNEDRAARGRALLAASELRAMLGETEAAEILAREAAATAPQLPLAPRQARGLAATPYDAAPLADALDAEGRQSPTHSGRVHDALLAADVLRLAGDHDGAARRWDQAVRVAPSDPRAPLARAAERLARRDLSHPALRLPDAPELQPLAEAIARALKIRGVAHPDVRTDEKLPNDALRRAREAIAMGELGAAAAAIAELARVPELRDAASWLAAALAAVDPVARVESVDWLRVVATKSGPARRALAARALELGASDVVEEAVKNGKGFSPADRAVLAFLAGVPHASSDEDLDALGDSAELRPLAAALAAVGAPRGRAERTAGTARSRDAVRLARLIAADAPVEKIEAALAPFDGDHDGETRAVALEMASRAGRFGEVSDAIAGWSDDDQNGARDRSLAAAFVAEHAGDRARAVAAYTSARAFDPANEAALRALVSLDPRCDIGAELRSLGDARGEGSGAAMAWLEAVARGGPDQEEGLRNGLLEAAHRAAPSIPIAAFLAERTARRAGDVDAVLRWIRERRSATETTPDAVQAALDDVVEALLVADRDPALATERLASAHRARPDDFALRELYERVAIEPPRDRASWREARAKSAKSPATKARLLLEAAHEHERTGDAAAALRDATVAHAAVGDGLARLTLERAEIDSGGAARLADALLGVARSTEDPQERREAYERLADLDSTGRDDQASALLWHRTILEADPHHLPSLRHVEHALLGDGRIDELEPVIGSITRTLVAAGDASAETSAHAQLAARLRMRGPTGEWAPTQTVTELAASFPEPSLWALRAMCAHARVTNDEPTLMRVSLALAARTSRPAEVAALFLRAGEAAMRADDLPKARELLERAATEDPRDVVTWGLLAEVRQQAGDPRGAADACESLARTSVVDEHRLLAWYDAGRLWLDEVGDEDRGVGALEQAAAIDLSFQDLFARLSELYARRGNRAGLAALLERRLSSATDDEDRVRLEVDRAQALVSAGEPAAARRALESALEMKPDDVVALSALADLCATLQDWEAAEQAWVRLARLVPDTNDQRDVYQRLGELYSEHSVNLARAEVAIKEVLKRAPGDIPTLERLMSVYQRQNDGPQALETAQQLLKMATLPGERRQRLVGIASVHETTTRDFRKAEQALEAARREFPSDVSALRSLAEFYQRQKQMPAVNILLDRASADARRSLAAGRFSPVLFEVLETVHELRGKRDAARVAAAVMSALEGGTTGVTGAGGRAGDPRLDDLLAPEALTASLRALLVRAGDALDAASALDLKALHVQPLAHGMAQSRIAAIASSLGVPPVQVLMSPQLGRTCVPSTSGPPSVVIGEPLVALMAEPAAAFVVTRALKLVQAHASALVRTSPSELAVLVAAWLQVHNASWTPQGVAPAALADAKRRLHAALPRQPDPDLGTIALEVAGTLGPHLATLGASTIAWADRVALLSVGDPNAALDGIAWSLGMNGGAPKEPDHRAAWVLHTAEVRDLLVFAVSDAFAEARARAGISA